MKICLVTRYSDFRGTGITRITVETLRGLLARGHDVCTVSVKGNSLYSYATYTLFDLAIGLPRQEVDVYHSLTTLEGMWLPNGNSVVTYLDLMPFLYSDHFGSGMGYSKAKNFLGRKYARWGWQRSARHSHLTCISNHVKNEMIEYLDVPENRVKVVRLGIRDDLEPQPNKSRNTFRIGTLGQHDKRKRIDLLINAFRESKLDAELVIAGDGMDRLRLEAAAQGDKRIQFVGLVPDEELCTFYNSLDLFIFPTAAEGYGLPPVEAMACKIPVVALADAVIPSDVKSHCIVVDNLVHLLGCIGRIENRISYWNRAVDRHYQFAKSHKWSDWIDQHIEIYKEVSGDSQ